MIRRPIDRLAALCLLVHLAHLASIGGCLPPIDRDAARADAPATQVIADVTAAATPTQLDSNGTTSTKRGFVAPTFSVGVRACSSLMLRLVDSVADACAIQLAAFDEALKNGTGEAGDSEGELRVAQVGPAAAIVPVPVPAVILYQDSYVYGGDDSLDYGDAYGGVNDNQYDYGRRSDQRDGGRRDGKPDKELTDEQWAELFERDDGERGSGERLPTTKPMNWRKLYEDDRRRRRKGGSKGKNKSITTTTTTTTMNSSAEASASYDIAPDDIVRPTTRRAQNEVTRADAKDGTAQDDNGQLIACLARVLRWLSEQLADLRAHLSAPKAGPPKQMDADGSDLVRALDTFARLHAPLISESACEMTPLSGGEPRELCDVQNNRNDDLLALDFVCQAIGVLSELAAEVDRRTGDSSSANNNALDGGNHVYAPSGLATSTTKVADESRASVALDVVKRHYAYLTQIVAAHTLVFGERRSREADLLVMRPN